MKKYLINDNTKVKKISSQEYLEIERKAQFKSEFYNGEMFALAGASFIHNKISSNIHISIGGQLKNKNCGIYQSDLKVKEQTSGLFTYPDLVVICGEPEFYDNGKDVVLNPTVIMEILSPSTENYDRGFKFELYRKLKSLKDFFLVSQEKVFIEHYSKNTDNSWTLNEYNNKEQSIIIKSIDCNLKLEDVYYKVNFEESKKE